MGLGFSPGCDCCFDIEDPCVCDSPNAVAVVLEINISVDVLTCPMTTVNVGTLPGGFPPVGYPAGPLTVCESVPTLLAVSRKYTGLQGLNGTYVMKYERDAYCNYISEAPSVFNNLVISTLLIEQFDTFGSRCYKNYTTGIQYRQEGLNMKLFFFHTFGVITPGNSEETVSLTCPGGGYSATGLVSVPANADSCIRGAVEGAGPEGPWSLTLATVPV